ncbi:MAG: DUF4293 domain-containing protein [Bacteroidales bacterium]|nr:DUF4293 domain-containing protein [Bacteroidales bacterium]
MWQRIQTLYLAIATGLILSMFFTLKAVVPAADGTVAESYRFVAYTPYLVLLMVITALNLLALTTWKQRVFQMRTTILAALITLALQIWLFVDYLATSGSMAFRISAVFPVVAVIFDLMAARRIHADELMVESMSRLRSSKRRR